MDDAIIQDSLLSLERKYQELQELSANHVSFLEGEVLRLRDSLKKNMLDHESLVKRFEAENIELRQRLNSNNQKHPEELKALSDQLLDATLRSQYAFENLDILQLQLSQITEELHFSQNLCVSYSKMVASYELEVQRLVSGLLSRG